MAYVGLLLVLCIPLAGLYGFVQLTQRAMGRLPSRVVSMGVTLVAAAFLFTFATSFIPVEITAENARAADFGYPLRFVTADTALSPPPGETAQVGWDPWEYPAEFRWPQFLVSCAIVAAFFLLSLTLVVAARRRARGRPPRPSALPSA